MRRPRTTPTGGAFTLVELLVTVAIISVLAAMAAGLVGTSRSVSRQLLCVQNLRSVAGGIRGMYMTTRCIPSDGPGNDLVRDLAPYVSAREAFHCRNDAPPTSPNSYQPYYVARSEPEDPGFVLGCPRHSGERAATLLGTSAVQMGRTACGTANGTPMPPEGAESARSISNGKMHFADGSEVVVTESGSGFRVTMIQSFQMRDGALYTVVRLRGEGKVDVAATPGSRFEVVTPVSIIGVRGTRFTVKTAEKGYHTDIVVQSGSVWVMNRTTGKTEILEAPATGDVDPGTDADDPADEPNGGGGFNGPPSACIRCPHHCYPKRDGRWKHCARCPAVSATR